MAHFGMIQVQNLGIMASSTTTFSTTTFQQGSTTQIPSQHALSIWIGFQPRKGEQAAKGFLGEHQGIQPGK
jgi:hypothetical protein